MTAGPVTLGPPALGQVMAGVCTVLRRPPTKIWTALRAGDLLWIREPFHLAARFGHLAPTAAAGQGARPIFATDLGVTRPADIGPRRIGYTLPRICHRQHLRVLEVRVERLQAISGAEIVAEGFDTRLAYRLAWERALLVSGSTASARDGPMSWAANPEVVVFAFERVARPIKELLTPKPTRRPIPPTVPFRSVAPRFRQEERGAQAGHGSSSDAVAHVGADSATRELL